MYLFRFRSTRSGDQAHKFQNNSIATDEFVIEASGNPVMKVFSYNATGYLIRIVQCARNGANRDYLLVPMGGVEHSALEGGGQFTCYDNNWWVLSASETRYPSSVPLCLRGKREGGDPDHLMTLNPAELTGLTQETSGFRIWAP